MRSTTFARLLVVALALALAPVTVVRAADPTLAKIGPDVVSVGDPDFSLRLTGSDFSAASVVLLDGQPLRTTFVSKRRVLGYVPAEVMSAAGTHQITVRTGQAVTAAKTFTVQPGTEEVEIFRVNPDALNVITTNVEFEVRIAGVGFTDSSKVLVFGAEVTTELREPGVLSARLSNAFVNAPAFVPFQVRSGGVLSNLFTMPVYGRAAQVADLDPGTIKTTNEPVSIKITGNGFSKAARVIIDGQVLVPTEVKPQQIKVVVPASLLDEPAQLPVYVEQETGLSNVTILRVVPSSAPFVYSLSPDRVQAGVDGEKITVNGAGFTETSKVLVNGAEVSTTFQSAGRLQFKLTKTQTASPATYTVAVRNKDGVTSNTATVEVVEASAVTTVAGKSIDGFEDGSIEQAKFRRPSRIAVGPDGLLYIADQLNHAIRRLTPETGTVETLAGDGIPGYIDTGDSTQEGFTQPRFNNPLGVAVAPDGTVYVADFGNNVIRRLREQSSGWVVDTVIGANKLIGNKDTRVETKSTRRGLQGFQNGTGAVARFRGPDGLALASDGTLFVADPLNMYVRAVDTASPDFTVRTAAGIGVSGYVDGDVTLARFTRPVDVALSLDESILYVADFANLRIREVHLDSGEVSTLSGSGVVGSASGTALVASFFGPLGVAVGSDGTVFVTDHSSNTIRRVSPDGDTTTLAGGGVKTKYRDGIGPVANFKDPRGIVYDASRGVLFVADQGHHRIRGIQP